METAGGSGAAQAVRLHNAKAASARTRSHRVARTAVVNSEKDRMEKWTIGRFRAWGVNDANAKSLPGIQLLAE